MYDRNYDDRICDLFREYQPNTGRTIGRITDQRLRPLVNTVELLCRGHAILVATA